MKHSKKFRRILLTGATGQVGWELLRTLAPLGEVLAPGREIFDLSQPEKLREKIHEWKPDLIVNPAAYTAVDQAESEHELAFTANAAAPKILAEEAELLQIPLIHYSTDYVFDGKKGVPYTEEDSPNPLNIYGESKLKGEQSIQEINPQHLILRTSWVYSQRGNNFLTTMLRLFQEKKEISIVDDQIGIPTWSHMIAEATAHIIGKIESVDESYWGLYHLTGTGKTSWFRFAEAILSMIHDGRHPDLYPVSSEEYPTIATRPLNTPLSSSRIHDALHVRLPYWEKQLEQLLISEQS